METTIQRDSSIPLYTQIAEALKLQIQSEELKAGENFPSERELAEQYGVSRMTVRQAVQRLRKKGLIYYERGVGTFVTDHKLDVHNRNLNGFSDEMISLGLAPSSKVLRLMCETADRQIEQELNLETDAEVFHLERLRLADDEPMAYEVTFLPTALCPELDKIDLTTNSLYQVLVQNYDLKMHHAAESLEAAAAAEFVAKQLGIETGMPVLVVHRVVFSESNQPIESARTTYRADRYRATFYLSKDDL